MRQQSATPDRVAAKIADRQHGVVSSRQLRSAGLTASGVTRRVRAGRLHRVHQGVYAVGRSGLSREGRWMAAVLACGPVGEQVALSHRAAAALWGLLPPRSGPIDVSVAGDGGRETRKGIRLHRCPSLSATLVTRRLGIPVTKPSRTIADLRQVASEEERRRAIRQAEVLGLRIEAVGTPDRTRSELERRFLRLCRQHGFPPPEVNVPIDSLEVDFLWRDRRLIVETDGYRYHRGRVAFEDDRDRDLRLRMLGYEVLRLTHRQLVDEPDRVAEALRAVV